MECLQETNDSLEEWESFISIVNSNPTARKITLESWKRCSELGIKPEKIKFKFLSDKDLNKKIKENSQLIEVSKIYMDSLSMSLNGIPHIVALSDKDGWIIGYRGTPEELGGKKAGLCIGSSWSEKDIGNNGAGTALAIGEPVLVYGIEHYGIAYGGCACIGVPIKYDNKIIGAMDISVPVKYARPERLHILVACANSIEATITYINNSNDKSPGGHINLQATSELIATAVHDLKNPLSVIRGLGQLGMITSDKVRVDNYLSRIITQADEMNDMIIELLSIFKPEKLMPQRVIPIIENIISSFDPICEHKKIKLSFYNNLDEYINMSEKLLKRAIENIINNAVQVMDDGGEIEILVEKNEDFMIIQIKDTAGGIPEDLSETLFEPFSFRRSGGTGLGLFMAYHTVTNIHKGQIWFETELGIGTTFFIKLPIAKNIENSILEFHKFI